MGSFQVITVPGITFDMIQTNVTRSYNIKHAFYVRLDIGTMKAKMETN